MPVGLPMQTSRSLEPAPRSCRSVAGQLSAPSGSDFAVWPGRIGAFSRKISRALLQGYLVVLCAWGARNAVP